MRVRLVVAAAVMSLAATSARSQSPSLVPIPYRTYIAVNPLGIPFDIASAEVESGVAQGVTIGGQASHTVLGDDHYSSFDAKVRYYPSEIVLRGFSLGVSLGHTHFSTLRTNSTGDFHPTLDFGTVGLLVDYNWMLGTAHRFVVGTGLGAKRNLASSDARSTVGLDRASVTARFVVGLAF